MFWFNPASLAFSATPSKFKYILCFGSTPGNLYSNFGSCGDLNTSYVLVQLSSSISCSVISGI